MKYPDAILKQKLVGINSEKHKDIDVETYIKEVFTYIQILLKKLPIMTKRKFVIK